MIASHPASDGDPSLRTLEDFLETFDGSARHGRVDGPRYRIGYSVLGEGEPVYIVSGICSTRRLYAPLAVELSQRFRVITYSLPGTETDDGASLKRYRLDDYPADLLVLADHLGDARFHVIGNSFGVSITIRALVQAPERIDRGILAGGFASRPLTRFERTHFQLMRYWPGRLRNLPLLKALAKYNHGPELEAREPAMLDFFLNENLSIPVRTAAAQVLAVDQTDVRATAQQVRQPTMILHGNEDRLVSLEHASELGRILPNVHIVIVPQCGHLPHLSHPELMAAAAEQFFGDAR